MCAIVDANVAREVFGSTKPDASKRPDAGKGFFEALQAEDITLVLGGKLTKELGQIRNFMTWAKAAKRRGILGSADEDKIMSKTKYFRNHPTCKSNDPHILGLAVVSGARLLYSNDKDLHKDFKSKHLPIRGKVYSTNVNKEFDKKKKRLIRDNVCPAKQSST